MSTARQNQLIDSMDCRLPRQHRRWLLPFVALLVTAVACRGGGSQALVFSPDQLTDAKVGQVYSATITVSQNLTPVGQMTVAQADLPAGISFAFVRGQNSAQLSGTPLHAGVYDFTVSAWCFGTNVSGQTGHHDYRLVVHDTASD